VSDIEERVNRFNTAQFIAKRPSVIELIPTVKTRTPSGGTALSDGAPRAAQILRLIELTSPSGNSPGRLRTQDGQQLKVTYQLLGQWDAVIEVGDHWEDASGAEYEVKDLLPYNGYEQRAEVTKRGP
jgi:hypothetical protein